MNSCPSAGAVEQGVWGGGAGAGEGEGGSHLVSQSAVSSPAGWGLQQPPHTGTVPASNLRPQT